MKSSHFRNPQIELLCILYHFHYSYYVTMDIWIIFSPCNHDIFCHLILCLHSPLMYSLVGIQILHWAYQLFSGTMETEVIASSTSFGDISPNHCDIELLVSFINCMTSDISIESGFCFAWYATSA